MLMHLANSIAGAVSVRTLPAGAYEVMFADGQVRPVTAAELLAATKAATIAANREQCRARIEARWPLWAQANCADGTYPQARVDEMLAWKTAHIAAENAAADLIEAATTVEAVRAIAVQWPEG